MDNDAMFRQMRAELAGYGVDVDRPRAARVLAAYEASPNELTEYRVRQLVHGVRA